MYKRYGKRLFDLFTAILASTILVLPGLFIYALIIAKDGRPGLYSQVRIGKNGKKFSIYKFRTMSLNQSSNTVTASNDPRITSLGLFLRKAKIDEWPQLINILKGDMSFVGPRPDVPGFADALEGDDRRILNLRPGVTGPATIEFRNEEEILAGQPDPQSYNRCVIWPKKVSINLDYERRHSFFLDLRIILKTIFSR